MLPEQPHAKQQHFQAKRWLKRVGYLSLALLALIAADYLLYPHMARMGGHSANTGENGLWLRYSWYFGQHTDAEVMQLFRRLQQQQIRYAYVHVRYLDADGRLHFRYARQARHLVTLLHRSAPGVKVMAWVFVGGERLHPHVELADPVIRTTVVREASWLVRECGFDGVQWDYEICRNGDTRLLTLLRDTRTALPPAAIIGVCSVPWYPAGVRRWIGWDEEYYARVAAACNQIAVMSYDSGIYLPRSYVWFIREQSRRITHAAATGNPRCRVLIGLPTYTEGGGGHWPYAENLRLGLKGLRESTPDPATFAGVALFADYTTNDAEWRDYQRWWLQQ